MEIVDWLDDYLKIHSFRDWVKGNVIAGKEEIKKVALAVDGDAVLNCNADMLISHHAPFWIYQMKPFGKEEQTPHDIMRKKEINLYVAHLPLDAHPEVGNSVELIKRIGFEPGNDERERYSPVKRVDTDIEFEELHKRTEVISKNPSVHKFGPDRIKEVYVCTGYGGGEISRINRRGFAYITGEFTHSSYYRARAYNVNVIALGHYNTETLGVKALGKKLEAKFDVETEFIDAPTGL